MASPRLPWRLSREAKRQERPAVSDLEGWPLVGPLSIEQRSPGRVALVARLARNVGVATHAPPAAAVSLALARLAKNKRFPAINARFQDLGAWHTPRRSANDIGGVVEAVVAPIS